MTPLPSPRSSLFAVHASKHVCSCSNTLIFCSIRRYENTNTKLFCRYIAANEHQTDEPCNPSESFELPCFSHKTLNLELLRSACFVFPPEVHVLLTFQLSLRDDLAPRDVCNHFSSPSDSTVKFTLFVTSHCRQYV